MHEYDHDYDVDKEKNWHILPRVPEKGILRELFIELQKIAESHALTTEETWRLVTELADLYDARVLTPQDFTLPNLQEGGSAAGLNKTESTAEGIRETTDEYVPLIDGTTILFDLGMYQGGVVPEEAISELRPYAAGNNQES